MVFCRFCAKTLHESAIACPHCGAPQAAARATSAWAPRWPPILACAMAGLGLLGLMDRSWISRDECLGALLVGALSGAVAAYTLFRREPGRNWAITAAALSVFLILAAIGSWN